VMCETWQTLQYDPQSETSMAVEDCGSPWIIKLAGITQTSDAFGEEFMRLSWSRSEGNGVVSLLP
jgi:hypothetical protein